MKLSKINYEDLSDQLIDSILFDGIIDDQLNGDCILVFGSIKAHLYRVPKAVELYRTGRSNKIIMSGSKEAFIMRDKALELGIPNEDIILETISERSTKENILGSMIVLDREFGLSNVKRIILVSTLYHMRRCMLMAKTYLPKWIDITLSPANDKNTLRDNWYLTEEGSRRAKNEAYKIISYIREGSIPDFNI